MNMQLTQKETMLLQDLKSQEQLCIDKYKKYAEQACDEQLKQIFSSIEQTEREHLNTLTQMLSGTAPMMASGSQQQQQSSQQQQQQSSQPKQSAGSDTGNQHDAYLCQDALSTEKHVSSSYNTSIFEFRDAQFRNALNHIQKEEQEHGKQIYDYMAANAMYA